MSKGSETKTFLAACAQFFVERGQVAKNLSTAVEKIQAAAAKGVQLVVLPEMWPTSFLQEPSVQIIRESREAEQEIARLSEELGIMVVGGGLEEEKGLFYNRAQIIDCGKALGSYRKIHMFSVNAEDRYMTAGSRPVIVDTRLGKIGVIICYDLRFPELVRYHFHKGVQVLAVPAQWPEARSDHWRTLLRARAIENQTFVLGCNRTGTEPSMRNDESLVFPGNSRIVDPMGEVIASASGEEQPVIAEIELRRCRSMQRILPVHKDRQPQVYRDLWQPVWENPEEPIVPPIPTVQEAQPSSEVTPPAR